MNSQEYIEDQLSKDLERSRIKVHPYNGFDYIESWDAIDRANKVFGFLGWDSQILSMDLVAHEQAENKYNKLIHEVCYSCKVRVTVYYSDGNGNTKIIFRDGSATGTGNSGKVSDAHDGAIKTAESDAEKRALRKFGNQFALALYDKEQKGVADEVVINPLESIDDAHKAVMENIFAEIDAWEKTIFCKQDLNDIKFTSRDGVMDLLNSIKGVAELETIFKQRLQERYASISSSFEESPPAGI